MEYTIEQGKRYKATIELIGFQSWASNDMIKEKLEDYGFSEVTVAGDGSNRVAYASWFNETVTGEIPPQIIEVQEYEYKLRQLNNTDDGW